MALPRLFIDAKLGTGTELVLDDAQARYVGRVLRLRVGDPLRVFNGDDGEYAAKVHAMSRAKTILKLAGHEQVDTESPLRMHLVQGISRGERMDLVIQKATELGVKRISPVFTAHGVVKLDAARATKRRDHWQKIATSACEQSGRIRPPLIDPPLPLKTWFGEQPKDADVDLILRPGTTATLSTVPVPQTKVCLLIGPEGGFSDDEYEDADVAGFAEVSLGPRILRTETAALAAVAVMQALWGDLRRN